jgi:hypothetical protein
MVKAVILLETEALLLSSRMSYASQDLVVPDQHHLLCYLHFDPWIVAIY